MKAWPAADRWTVRLDPYDGRALPSRPPGSAAGGCVVFFTRRADPEVSELSRLLALLGVPSCRVDADDLGSIQLDPRDPGVILIDGRRVRPTVGWTRRFWPSAMAAPRTPADVLHRDSWIALVRQSPAFVPVALPGPRLGLIEQLADAARAGVRVPATIVTTDPGDAASGLPGDRLVVKTLDAHFAEPRPGTLHGFSPRILPRDELAGSRGAAGSPPLVVQEYVRHQAEYRVYTIGGELIGCRVGKASPAAIWHDGAAVQVRMADVEPEVAAVVAGLAERWGLGFGAFDVLLTGDGAVFLEANADGDWRWYERRAGVRSISRAIAMKLRDLHRAAGGRIERPGAGLPSLMAG